MNYLSIIIIFILSILPAISFSTTNKRWIGSEPAEQQLIEMLDALESGNDKNAYRPAKALTTSHPNFQLAQLVYGDLLSIRGMHPVAFDNPQTGTGKTT